MNCLNRILKMAMLGLVLALLAAPLFGQTTDNSTWNGGTGVWTTTSLWTINGQLGTVYPNNTASAVFNVTIDSGQQDFVTLTSPPAFTINSLTLGGNPNFSSSLAVGENGGAAGMLTIGSDTTPASLTVNSTGNLFVNAGSELLLNIVSGNGTVTNNGVINVGSASVGAKLGLFDGGNTHQLTLSGSGTLTLSSGSTLLGGEGDEELINESTIEGGGTISNLGVVNGGTIIANGTSPLVIDANTNQNNEGFQNSAFVQVDAGSTLDIDASAATTAANQIFNSRTITVNDGGTLEFSASAGQSVKILNSFGSPAQIDIGGSGAGGTLELDGSNATFDLYGSGGLLTLSDNANNLITGVTGTETFINDTGQTLSGAGTISNLALVNNGTIIANGTNALNVDPNANGFLNNGTLQVNSGSTLNLSGFTASTSSATVTVNGTLNVTPGGTLRFNIGAGNTSVTNNGLINLNSASGTGSTLLVYDAGNARQLTLSGSGALTLQPGSIIDGEFGDEELINDSTIQGAGTISNLGVVNMGTIIANGTSPLVINANTNQNNQGFQNSGLVQVDAGSTLNIDASAAATAVNQIFNSDSITVNDGGTLEFSASAGQSVKIENSLGSPAQIDIGGSGSGGTLDLDGSNAIFDVYGSGGLLTLSDNANNLITGITGTETFINDAGQTLSGAGTISNLALVNNGTIIANGTNALNIDPNSQGFTNNGTVDIQGSKLSVNGSIQNNGTLEVSGSAAGAVDVNGTLLNAGTLFLASPGDSAQFNILTNSGPIGVNSGAFVGVGRGDFTATSGYQQLANGTLDELISGVFSMGTFGVTGPASLDGTLEVTLEDGFIPTVGEQFFFLDFTAGELSGTFADFLGQTFDNGLEKWDLSYNNTAGDLVLTAVANTTTTTPEPGSLLLFGTGLLGLAALLRKRRPVTRG